MNFHNCVEFCLIEPHSNWFTDYCDVPVILDQAVFIVNMCLCYRFNERRLELTVYKQKFKNAPTNYVLDNRTKF